MRIIEIVINVPDAHIDPTETIDDNRDALIEGRVTLFDYIEMMPEHVCITIQDRNE